MSATPNDLISVQLSINGKITNALIIEIEVFKSINKIARAIVVLNDGSKALDDFKLSDSSDFDPGNKIEIKAGYNSKEQIIFKGIILSHAISIDSETGPSLRIECKDEAVTLTHGLKNNYFIESSDSDIINTILGNYSLSTSIDSTSVKNKEVIQYGTSDWDFILSRADANGFVVVTDDGKFCVKKPDVSSAPVHRLNYGDNIIELHLALHSESQLNSVNAVSWNASNQELIDGTSQEPTANQQGNISGKKLATVLNTNEILQTPIHFKKDALDTFASAKLLTSRLSRFQGTILCEGNALIKPNTVVKINGIGKKFNGDAFVSAVSHDLSEGRWLTEITIGLDSMEASVNKSKGSDLIPAMNGLQIGIVKKIHDDPTGEFRVLVALPLIKDSHDGVWARFGTSNASNGFGNFFYPEIGDEVILGFLDGNASVPIILGSVYSGAHAPASVPNKNNSHKSITTASGMTIDFDEEDRVITFKTPGKNIITVSDKDKAITLTDQNCNSVKLNETGITIDSKKDIFIKAANTISIAAAHINVNANSDLNLSANNISEKAQTSYSAEAGASAKLKASGNTTIEGAMVSIN